MKLRRLFLTGLFSSFITAPTVLADSNWFPYIPRVSGSGLVSNNQDIFQGDAMAALVGNDQNILWVDVAGKNALDSSWAGNLGAGYRYVYDCQRILGFYLFVDDSHALEGGHQFWDLSPGIESMGQLWDFRVNGYFPVSNKNPLVREGFADTFNQYQFIVFSGHNQYDRLLDLYQAVGNGVDGEVGRLLIPGLTVYAGGYYFGAGSSSSTAFVNPQTVKGVSGRAQYEFNSHTALEISDTYDNVLHDTILGGIRFTLGGTGASDQDRSDISGRLLDPVERELATQGQGTAIPIQNQLQLGSGLLLERGNIWFFEPGGSPVPNSKSGQTITSTSQCTFEHPCSPAAFNQDNINSINGIAPDANFYLASADYTAQGSGGLGNPLILNGGQSIFGREAGFVQPAQGNDRPLLSGSMSLLEGYNQLDSIRLLDSATGTGAELTALDIENAPHVLLTNDDINATTTVIGDNAGNNTATAISAINSQIYISNSSIETSAVVTGNNNDFNFATGIGNSLGEFVPGNSFSGNRITLVNSNVNVAASVLGDNGAINFAAGIGLSAGFNAAENVSNNVINIINSSVISMASMENNNQISQTTGIGYNSYGSLGSFSDNNITITNSIISATALVNGNNGGNNNSATGIGNNDFNSTVNNLFIGNQINISNSSVIGAASVIGNNDSSNLATGIGNNKAGNTTPTPFDNFTDNMLTIRGSNIIGVSSIGGDNNDGGFNFANGIGNNTNMVDANFQDNTVNISNSSINGTATTSGNNGDGSHNFANGIGTNGGAANLVGNTINVNNSTIAASASVGGNNNDGTNQAIGVFVNNITNDPAEGNIVNIYQSTINVSALIAGDDNGTNIASGLVATGTNDHIHTYNTNINVTS
jgi:hypothetical protein